MIFKNMENNIRKIRLSQTDKNLRSGNKVAALLGITPQYYYNLETGRDGKRLNIDHITKLAKIFNVSTDELLADSIVIDDFENVNDKLMKLVLNKENAPYIVLSQKAREKGLSPETLEKLIDLWGSK
jgi:transcriptional regulator with XRE-family HTH domain